MRRFALVVLLVSGAVTLSSCSTTTRLPRGVISVVSAERQYGSLAAQIGGRFVRVASIMNSPVADPHSFEVSRSVAEQVAHARIVIQNGLGYDGFMTDLEAASPTSKRVVIEVGLVAHRLVVANNPHIWLNVNAMVKLVQLVDETLQRALPGHRAYFHRRADRLIGELISLWGLSRGGVVDHGAQVAATEPIAGYLLPMLGFRDLAPANFERDVMNGVEPAPQLVSQMERLIDSHAISVLVVNGQVSDPLTRSLAVRARANGEQVVSIDEIMSQRYRTYQRWVIAISKALVTASERPTKAARP